MIGAGDVCLNLRVARVEGAGGGIDEIAALGDGQRDDADRRIGHRLEDRGLTVLDGNETGHRADHPGAVAARVHFHHGIEAVLLHQRGALLGVVFHHTRAEDAPVVRTAKRDQIVEIDGLMGAVEVAHADMQDARADSGGVIARLRDRSGKIGKGLPAEFHGHDCLRLDGGRSPVISD